MRFLWRIAEDINDDTHGLHVNPRYQADQLYVNPPLIYIQSLTVPYIILAGI